MVSSGKSVGGFILSIFHFNLQHDSYKEMSKESLYCIVDIETTGGQKGRHKMTEIAMILFDGERVVDQFESLINPEMSIPYHITQLTGISNAMVENAPKFYEVAKKIVEFTQDNIFVAHNVFFDYNFIQAEFRELGFPFRARKMCTVRLARKIFPGHKSYSLGNICRDLNIEIQNRHRAMGDALATTELFRQMIQKSPEKISTIEEQSSKRLSLPPYLNEKDFESLPKTPGVYFFWNQKGELLYVGKSKNIKTRISSHFRLNIKRPKDIELKNSVRRITYEETGSDLIAKIYECHLIKSLKPYFNVSLRQKKFPYTLKAQADQKGLLDFNAVKRESPDPDCIQLKSLAHAKKIINKFYKDEFGLTYESYLFEKQRDLFIQTIGIEKYNQKFINFLNYLKYPEENFAIKFSGRTEEEECFLEIRHSQIGHLNFMTKNESVKKIAIQEDSEMRNMFMTFLVNERPKILPRPSDQEIEFLEI